MLRLSQKRQSRQRIVENKKGLSETTKPFRKQERFAGKDKAFFGPELAK
jgi:hypothetical protein